MALPGRVAGNRLKPCTYGAARQAGPCLTFLMASLLGGAILGLQLQGVQMT